MPYYSEDMMKTYASAEAADRVSREIEGLVSRIAQLEAALSEAIDDKHAWAAREVRAERECCAAIADISASNDRKMYNGYGGPSGDPVVLDCAITAEAIAAQIRSRNRKAVDASQVEAA